MNLSWKRLWRDKRGNAIVVVAAALPLVIGSAGLATDTVQWALWKRQIQRTADSAALAGVYAAASGDSHTAAVDVDIAKNNHTGMTPTNKQVTQPTVAGFENAVRVSLTVSRPLTFSSMFLSTAPSITAVGTAAVSKEGNYCVIALNNTTTPSIVINGNVTMNFGCGIISNSTSTSSSQTAGAIAVSGNSHIVNAVPIAGQGVVPSINGTNTEMSYQLEQSDPYAGKYSTTIPSGLTARTLAQHISNTNQTVTHGGQSYNVINPGLYRTQGSGNNQANSAFSTSNSLIALNPGTYYIDSANFDIGANSKIIVNPSASTDQGVTIILTGASPGAVNIASNAEVKLRAPNASPATDPYFNMLFIQAPGATATSTISGNTVSSYDGTFYFPNTTVNYNGGASDTFKCAMIVGWIVEFSGNTNLQNNTTGCYANQQEEIDRVRLVG